MAVMFRNKEHDQIAAIYGPYYNWKELCKIHPGTVLDILCNDGLHYHVDLKEIDYNTGFGVLHFVHWSKKYDYKGQLKDLYLAEKDLYSKINMLSDKNNYVKIIDKANSQSSSSSLDILKDNNPSDKKEKQQKQRTKVHEVKYDSDFLGPPKTNGRKRIRVTESVNEIDDNTLNNSNGNDNDNDNNSNSNNNDDNYDIDNQNVNNDQTIVSKNSALVQFAGVVESRKGRTIKRVEHFDELQAVSKEKVKKRRGPAPQVKEEKIQDVINTITMTAEEIDKKKKENVINMFATYCSTSVKEDAKIISLLSNGRELFSALGLNVDQVNSLLLARKTIDQTLNRLLEITTRQSTR